MNRTGNHPAQNHSDRWVENPLLMGVTGLLVTGGVILVGLSLTLPGHRMLEPFLWLMAAGSGVGVALRALRCHLFRGLSWPDSICSEARGQLGTLLFPRRQTRLGANLSLFEGLRAVAAAAFLLMVAGILSSLAGHPWAGWGLMSTAAVLTILWATGQQTTTPPLLAVVTIDFLVLLLEGMTFSVAAVLVEPQFALWQTFLLYSITHALFHLSSGPVAHGALALSCAALSILPGIALSGALLFLVFRLARTGPVLLLAGILAVTTGSAAGTGSLRIRPYSESGL